LVNVDIDAIETKISDIHEEVHHAVQAVMANNPFLKARYIAFMQATEPIEVIPTQNTRSSSTTASTMALSLYRKSLQSLVEPLNSIIKELGNAINFFHDPQLKYPNKINTSEFLKLKLEHVQALETLLNTSMNKKNGISMINTNNIENELEKIHDQVSEFMTRIFDSHPDVHVKYSAYQTYMNTKNKKEKMQDRVFTKSQENMPPRTNSPPLQTHVPSRISHAPLSLLGRKKKVLVKQSRVPLEVLYEVTSASSDDGSSRMSDGKRRSYLNM
jgi:hypothetical protein